jgi:hypothetical protein
VKFPRLTLIAGAAAAVTAVAAAPAAAAPVVTQATGPDTASIQGAVTAFSDSLGANNGTGPPAASGRRQIAWDGTPDDRSSPFFMPEGQFRANGALFSTPGLGFQVSADDNDPADTPIDDPDQVEYTNINPTYDDAFGVFSPEKLFAPIGSNVTDQTFVRAGTTTPAETSGLGVVFTDVDQQGPTKIEYLEADGESLGTFTVPAAADGNEDLSFLGVRFDAGERVALARITTGAAPLGNDDVTQGGAADIVAMDNFIYGEPQEIPPEQPQAGEQPQPDRAAPTIDLKGVPNSIDAKSLGKGLKVQVTTNEEANVQASLLAKASNVELRAQPQVILATQSLGFGTGERQLNLKPAKKLLRKADGFKAELEVTATDRSGNTTTVEDTLKVKKTKKDK